MWKLFTVMAGSVNFSKADFSGLECALVLLQKWEKWLFYQEATATLFSWEEIEYIAL